VTVWVVNTSPLIFLSHLDRLDLLHAEGREVVIPRAVLDEVLARADCASTVVQQARKTWLKVKEVSDRIGLELIRADLHGGEAEAMMLAKELSAERLVIDDQDARRFADRAGIKTIGTLGLLLAAKRKGQVSSVRHEIEKLQSAGFRVNPRLVAAVLKEAGE